MGLFDDLIPKPGGGGPAPAAPLDIANVAASGALDPKSRDLAIRTIFGEAANEPEEGQAAVAHVIKNRVMAGRYGGKDVPSVVMAPNQFEPWNGGAAKQRMLALDPNSPQYQALGAIVDKVWSGEAPDPTGGMTHFFAPKAQAALGRKVPSWARGENLPIGGHTFFAPEGRVGNAKPASAPGGLFAHLVPKEGTAPLIPVESAPLGPAEGQTDMGGYSPAQVPQAPAIHQAEAIKRGIIQGATANFGDEAAGLIAASRGAPNTPVGKVRGVLDKIPGANVVFAPYHASQGLAALGWDYLTGRNTFGAKERYEQATEQARSENAIAEQQYPGSVLGGKVAGGLATAGVTPAARVFQGFGMLPRIGNTAVTGAAYGGLAGVGEGESAEERLNRGASGAVIGGAVGGAAVPAAAAVGAAGRGVAAAVRPVTSAIRGAINPEAEAGRRVVGAVTRDMRNGETVMSPAEFAASRAAGGPAVVADLGGETTRALARSAANTSTEGRATIQAVADARFEGQADRATTFIREIVGGPVDVPATREGLRAAAGRVNRPAYQAAERAPAAQNMWDDGFEQLMQAPAMQEAARGAARTGANRGALEGPGAQVRNPFHWDQNGQWTLAGDARPTLRFWDHVKRNLDDQIESLNRAGNRSAARDVREIRDTLVRRLDDAVPEYQAARAGAARFFGADDALTAGENFVRSGMTAAEGRRALAQMSAEERALFQQGFAARLIDDINRSGDRVNVVNKIANSREAREKMQAVLGPDGFRRMQAFLTVEQSMDRLRTATQGNSTTVRQLVEMGLAGGAGYGLSGGDLTTGGASVIAAALVRKGGVRIDERVARRVAEMLTSNDPQVLARGVRAAASNQRILEAFRGMAERLSRLSGPQNTTAVPALQSGAVGRAEDQQQVPRPPGQ